MLATALRLQSLCCFLPLSSTLGIVTSITSSIVSAVNLVVLISVRVMTGSRLSTIKVLLASYLCILSKQSGVIQLRTNAFSMEVMDHYKTKISTTHRSYLQWHTAAKLISATPFAWITFQWGQWSSPVLHQTSKLIWMLQWRRPTVTRKDAYMDTVDCALLHNIINDFWNANEMTWLAT